MIYYSVSLFILSRVLVTTSVTFNECFNCKWKNDPYFDQHWYSCKNESVISCFDELTRNVSFNPDAVITVKEVRDLGYKLIGLRIRHQIIRDAEYYILKLKHYNRYSTYTSYNVRKPDSSMRNRDSMAAGIKICNELNVTVWPVTDGKIGEAAFKHFKPSDFPCKLYNNGELCTTLSINPELAVHETRHMCNSYQLEWQAKFENSPIHIGLYIQLSQSDRCDHSNSSSFCTAVNYPMEEHVVSNKWNINFHTCKSTALVKRQSTLTRKNNQLTMPQLNYDSVYKLIFVLGLSPDGESSLPNTTLRNWMVGMKTTYTYYLRTYSRHHQCKQMNETTNSNRVSVASIALGAVILLILVLIGSGMVMHKRRSRKKQSKRRRFNESIELREERYHDMIRCPTDDDDLFEIDCDGVLIFKDQILGQGAFGKVYKGKIKGLARTSFHAASKLTDDQERAENMLVAVKQCYEFADAATKREFLREIQVMKELYQHESLVNILHCITQFPHKPFSLIVEYCEHGDLRKFLQNSKVYLEELQTDEPDHEKIILFDDVAQITFEVADGMAYLAEKGYIHRDLAARNIMVTKGKHVKIGDFELCRSVVSQDDVYTTKGGRLPIKWMAIESLYDYQFSTKSDVWSYGVLLYEVTTLGLQPYADVVPQDGDFRRAMIAHLRSGARLEQPPSCPDEIYAIKQRTWAEKPEHRASFAEIRETARRLVESLHDLDGGVYGDRYVGVEMNRCDQSDGEE